MKRGFTLIEALIYFALTSAIITGIIVSVYPLFTNTDRGSMAVLRDLESAFVFQKVAYLLNGASVISTPSSGASGGVLTLTIDGDVRQMELDSGVVKLDDVALTSSRVEIENLIFTRTSGGGTLPDTLTVNFDANGVAQGPYTRYVRF